MTPDQPTDDETTSDEVTDDSLDAEIELGDAGTDDLVDETPEELEDELEEEELERVAAKAPGPRKVGAFRRLYRGETSFDFVGRRRWWFTASMIIILAGVISLGVRGLNLGITFKGGQSWTVGAPGVTQTQAVNAVQAAGLTSPTVEIIGTGSKETIRVTADLNTLPTATRKIEITKVTKALAQLAKTTATKVTTASVGPTWGGQVTQRAVTALIAFLVLVALYIAIRFEPKMAIAAFIALLHDLAVTIGVYSLAGFQVTPDTVIAVLTIMGYSLYDTVVVFDRVRDNTRGLGASGRMTYSDMVNLSMNQTLARSINTSLVAILPVLAVLLIGAQLLGAITLQNYGLALFIGLLSGAYSSIFIASPILAVLKEREPRYTAVRQRIATKGDRLGLITPSAAAALVASSAGSARAASARGSGALRPGQSRAGRPPVRPRPVAASTNGGSAEPVAATTAPKTARPSSSGRTTAPPRPGSRPPQRPRKNTKGKGKRR